MRGTIFVLMASATLAGCASSPTRFWTIEAVAPPSPPSPAGHAIAPIQLAAVHLPLAFDRLEIVRHDRSDRVRVLDFDRWSAPPGTLMRTALTRDLAARLPAGSIVYPEAPAVPGMRRLVVDIVALQHDAAGYRMQLSWSLLPQPAPSRQVQLTAAGTDDVAGQTRAIATMIDQLAGNIAATLEVGG